jgi:hypothetical protein
MYTISKIPLSLIIGAFSVTWATYPGSIIGSWDATYKEGSWEFYPMGFTHDGGYIWVYTGNWIFKRLPENGSIVHSVSPYMPPAQGMGFDEGRRYLYAACYVSGIYIVNSANGETIASYPVPSGLGQVDVMDYNEAEPSAPVWTGDRFLPVLYNLTSACSFVRSLDTSFSNSRGLAYAADAPGGPYLFVGSAPATIYALNPASGSIYYSFTITLPNGLCDLAWDPPYLWTADNYLDSSGYIYRFVALPSAPTVSPSSFGKIKALYR